MSETTKQIEGLRELHADHGGEIRRLLDEACEHDAAARACRKQAGQKLAALRAANPQTWRKLCGVNERMADLLLDMARGRN